MITVEAMKEQIKAYTRKQKDDFKGVEEPWNTITLYHGTTTRYLNDIFQNGLTPRTINQVNNFSDVPSNEELVYLTSRWHYWYAYNANQQSLINQLGEKRFEVESIKKLWNETSDFPMYVGCEVPVELLTLDEDVVYQKHIRIGLRDGTITSPEDISIEMCLAQGTVASLQPISPEYINEIIILGNEEYKDYLLNGQYGVDASNWFSGLGLGHADLWELIMLELTRFKKGNKVLDIEYPLENNPLIQKIIVEEDGLCITHQNENY